MRLTLRVLQIPASHTAVLLVGIFSIPASYGGGGSQHHFSVDPPTNATLISPGAPYSNPSRLGVLWGWMKSQPRTAPLEIPPDIAAKCTGPDQFEKFDRLFRSVISVPKADIDKAEAKWRQERAKKRKRA
jgi:hypothetical protein